MMLQRWQARYYPLLAGLSFGNNLTLLSGACPTASQKTTALLERLYGHHKRQYHAAKSNGRDILATLEERGLLGSVAGPRHGLQRLLDSKSVGVYCGVDPTAKSMHIGNLLPLMVLFWLYRYGHFTRTLVGGGTVTIGDPSWRDTARDIQSSDEQSHNAHNIEKQMLHLWGRIENLTEDVGTSERGSDPRQWRQLNNAEWLGHLPFLEIMGTVGKGIRVSALLAKDSMRTRLGEGQDKSKHGGLNLSELNYVALQSWDFWHLYRKHDVQLQVGGGDQYGNITTGVDAVQYMIRQTWSKAKVDDDLQRSYGLTTPLVTIGQGANAKKMGKSSGNAVWLSPEITNDFELYQYFLRLDDSDVETFWKMYTFTPIVTIEEVMSQHNLAPEHRVAHHRLAHDFLSIHRGVNAADQAQKQHSNMFVSRSKPVANAEENQTSSEETSAQGDNQGFKSGTQYPTIPYPATLAYSLTVASIAVDIGLCESKAQVGRMTSTQGGLYYGHQFEPLRDKGLRFKPFSPSPGTSTSDDRVSLGKDSLLLLRRGKWKLKVLRIIPDREYNKLDQKEWSPAWAERQAVNKARRRGLVFHTAQVKGIS